MFAKGYPSSIPANQLTSFFARTARTSCSGWLHSMRKFCLSVSRVVGIGAGLNIINGSLMHLRWTHRIKNANLFYLWNVWFKSSVNQGPKSNMNTIWWENGKSGPSDLQLVNYRFPNVFKFYDQTINERPSLFFYVALILINLRTSHTWKICSIFIAARFLGPNSHIHRQTNKVSKKTGHGRPKNL